MNNIFTAYKKFSIDNIDITALGDLDKELGDELRAFKKKSIDFPTKITEQIKNYYSDYIKTNNKKFDIILYIPSNKNNGVMDFFANYISKEFDIKKCEFIKINKNIKEQKFLETLKERSENIKDAFKIINYDKLKNKNILLIDDVYASGETIKEIIKIFKGFQFNYNLEILIFCYRNHIFR
ncbi:ComF family protein [Brachyspira hyodysenteriae]|uniref:ComF family protein n=1 Tax=Brachyspira hyodysenteriae TaxID=159 RepID=UPI0009BAD04D|nr:phosphoribosyltransferase family protein [Brachyspira hyodysenteriae]MCZ9886789.1 amidophosphoribosyltransferase [Brachyspira hyodysenteriae]MCZ9981498.1 amidophosphoribosyltransferase [Brachyspira hyodysenteriae]